MDAGDFERSGAIDRKDAAIGRFKLRVDRARDSKRE
jgi:hypothetical protein